MDGWNSGGRSSEMVTQVGKSVRLGDLGAPGPVLVLSPDPLCGDHGCQPTQGCTLAGIRFCDSIVLTWIFNAQHMDLRLDSPGNITALLS